MLKPSIRKSVRALAVEDRLELLEELSHSIAADQRDIPLLPWQRKVVRDRMAAYEKNPEQVISGEAFKVKLRAGAAKLAARAATRPQP